MEERPIPRRNAKDTVFTDLFRDPKYLLQLYRCLHPEDREATEEQITQVTRKGILTNSLYNDLGFLIEDRLIILVEAQSTWSINIILRVLMYLTQTYQDFLNQKGQEQSVYSSTKVSIPKPEVYVIYTGRRTERKEVLTLSEEFFGGQECALEVRVKIIRDGKQGDIINQYVAFTRVFDEQIRQYGRTNQAVWETIRICRDEDILKEYLRNREKEATSIMMSLFDEETIMRTYIASERRIAQKEGREEGRVRGLEEGRQEGTLFALRNLMKNTGMSVEQAMAALSIAEADRPRYAGMLEQ